MGFFTSLSKLYASIRKSRPNLTDAQVRAEAERYLNGPLRPMLSPDEIYEALASENVRREGVIPELPRYTSAERKARRERAAAIRKGMYTYIRYQSEYLNEFKYRLSEGGRDPRDPKLTEPERQEILKNARSYIDRAEQHLFYYVPPTATPEEKAQLNAENREIAFLFNDNEAHWEKYYSDRIAEMKKGGDPAYAGKSDAELKAMLEDDLATRRGQAVMRRAHIAGAMLEQAEAMSDPSLPAEQLAHNYFLLMQEQTIAMEALGGFIAPAQKGRYKISEEDIQYLLHLDHEQIRFASAAERIAAYGNPITEFIDPGDLAGYACNRLDEDYENKRGNEGEDYYAELKEKHTHYDQYKAGGVLDNLENIDGDVSKSYPETVKLFGEVYQGMLERSGFTLGEGGAKVTCEQFGKDGSFTVKENAGVDELASGRPLVVEQDGHVAVLSQRYPTSTELVWDKPEALFNYSLRYQNDKLTKQLEDSDKWYKTRSGAFRDMRRSFEDIAKLTKNGLTGDAQQRETLAEKYADLLAKTNTYLEKKRLEGVNDGHSPLEQGHIRVARELKKYAEQRIGELDTVEKARKGLTRFAGMSAQEIQKAARRDAYNAQQRVDRADMAKWLKERCASYENDGLGELWKATNVRAAFLSHLLNINQQEQAENFIYICDQGSQSAALLMVGGMVAMEMIRNEREQRRAAGKDGLGSLERYMNTNSYVGAMRELGEAAVKYTVGVELGEDGLMTNEQFTEFLTRFHPEEMAAEMPETQAVRRKADQRDAVDAPLREAKEKLSRAGLGSLGQFAKEHIVAPLDTLRSEFASGKETVPRETALELMGSCVIYSMVQIGDLGGGAKFERLLRDPKSAEALQLAVETSDKFFDMMADTLTEGGKSVSVSAVSKLLEEKKPQQLAKQILTSANFKKNLDNGLAIHDIKLEKGGFKLGDPKPPAMGPKK